MTKFCVSDSNDLSCCSPGWDSPYSCQQTSWSDLRLISFWNISLQNRKTHHVHSQTRKKHFPFSGQPWPQLALLQLDGSTLAGWHRGHPHHHHCLSYPGSVFKVILKQSQNRDMLQSCCDPQHFTCQVVYTLYCVMVDSKRAGW